MFTAGKFSYAKLFMTQTKIKRCITRISTIRIIGNTNEGKVHEELVLIFAKNVCHMLKIYLLRTSVPHETTVVKWIFYLFLKTPVKLF